MCPPSAAHDDTAPVSFTPLTTLDATKSRIWRGSHRLILSTCTVPLIVSTSSLTAFTQTHEKAVSVLGALGDLFAQADGEWEPLMRDGKNIADANSSPDGQMTAVGS